MRWSLTSVDVDLALPAIDRAAGLVASQIVCRRSSMAYWLPWMIAHSQRRCRRAECSAESL